ncbi:acidic leucine-rich nuclear phosphoprotein 32-related protein-like [Vigna radiata var. radiata]|uniref:Acidic leucine-rich nuclear phosphoprotein 32-related protein-like n=1 Tax=Vigna radiata var. radiata TaxID=3916 RepID=A0A3Q0FC66_VIGRR|nr:acidic leucine-rich nuclear phosphoprotein 32-related protein-like [Vigna radiata var. radiata]
MDDCIKVVVHHTGHFVSDDNGNLKFDGEITQWSCDPDLFCYCGIITSVKELGHKDIKEVWYSLGGQSVVPERLELLTDDRGALHMVNIAMLNGQVHLYIVHNRNEPEIIEMIEWVDGVVNDEVHVGTQVEGEGEVQAVTEMQNGHGEGECEVEREVDCEVEGEAEVVTQLAEGEVQREVEAEVEGEVEVVTQLAEGEVQREVEAEVEGEAEVVTQLAEGEVQREVEKEVEAEVEGEGEGLTQLEEVELANVDEVEVHDVDDFELKDVEDEDEDENIEDDEDENVDESSSEESLIDVTIHCDNIDTSKRSLSEEQPCSSWTSGNDDMNDVCGISDNKWVSDDLDSGPDSENESSIPRSLFPTFSMPKILEEYKWEVETYFTEKNEFKEAIRTYALSNG